MWVLVLAFVVMTAHLFHFSADHCQMGLRWESWFTWLAGCNLFLGVEVERSTSLKCLFNLDRRAIYFNVIFSLHRNNRMKQNGRGFSKHEGARGCDVYKSQGPSAWTFALRPAHRDSSGKCLWPCWRVAWAPRDAMAFDDKGMWKSYKCMVGRRLCSVFLTGPDNDVLLPAVHWL